MANWKINLFALMMALSEFVLANNPDLQPVRRFYNNTDHWLTNDASEVNSEYFDQGAPFLVYKSKRKNRQAIYKCWDKKNNNHFLSLKQNCIEKGGQNHQAQGRLGYVETGDFGWNRKLFRCYHIEKIDHLTTIDRRECVNNGYDEIILMGYAPMKSNPIHRFWNGKDHFFTLDKSEGKGYTYEGAPFETLGEKIQGTLPIYRCLDKKTGNHFVTDDRRCRFNGIAKTFESSYGNIFKEREPGTVGLYECTSNDVDTMVTTSRQECKEAAGYTVGRCLGYVKPTL